VVRNLALVPALTGAQAPARAGDSDATRQPELAQANNLLTSEQTDWIKSLLPKLADGATGWWEVEARGKGFGIKFRWRARGQHTLTFARVSRAAYQRLVKMRGQTVQIGGKTYGKAEWYLCDWVRGQLGDLQHDRDRERRDKARQVAAMVRLEPRDH